MAELKGVLVSGAVIQDTLVRPVESLNWGTTTIVETVEQHIGGNAANTSIALAKLGVPVRTMAAVGPDDSGRFVLDRLARAGVDISAVRTLDGPSASTVGLINSAGNRLFFHRPGVDGPAFAAPLDFPADLTAGMSHYHLASLFILPEFRPHAAETLARARAAGLTTSLDTNWDPRGRWMQDLEPCFPGLDFLFMNEDEARESKANSGAILAQGVGAFVLKVGGRGCVIYTGDFHIVCPAFEVPVQDTTGAGDCFVAGFLAAWLRGATLAECGRFANAVGALNVQRLGATAGLLSYEETRAWMTDREPRP